MIGTVPAILLQQKLRCDIDTPQQSTTPRPAPATFEGADAFELENTSLGECCDLIADELAREHDAATDQKEQDIVPFDAVQADVVTQNKEQIAAL